MIFLCACRSAGLELHFLRLFDPPYTPLLPFILARSLSTSTHQQANPPTTTQPPATHSNNRLQLPRIPQSILDSRLANLLLIALAIRLHRILRREVYPAVLDQPAPALRELYDGALGVEEEKIFGG